MENGMNFIQVIAGASPIAVELWPSVCCGRVTPGVAVITPQAAASEEDGSFQEWSVVILQ